MTNKRGKRPPAVDYERFVRVWNRARSVDEVARKLKISPNTASTIAWRLRKADVELKRFPRRPTQPIDAKRLNRIGGRR